MYQFKVAIMKRKLFKSKLYATSSFRGMSIWQVCFTPADALGAEQSLLFVTYLLGLTPFRLRGHVGERHFVISRIGYLNTFLQLIFFMYCFGWALAEQESIVGYFFKSEVSRVGDTIQKFVGMTGMLILFGCSCYRTCEIISMCDMVARTDVKFLNVGVSFNYGYIMRLRHSKLFFIICVNFAYLSSSMWLLLRNDIWPTFQASIVFFVPHIFLLSIVVLYSAFLMRFWQHFELLNKLDAMWLPCRLLHNIRQPHDVYTCFSLLFVLALFFGITPYHIATNPSPTHLRASYFGYINMFGRIAFYNGHFIYSLLEKNSLLSHIFFSNISNVTDSLQKFNCMFGISIVIFISWLKRHWLVQLFGQFEVIEKGFIAVGVTFIQGRTAAKVNTYSLLMVLTIIGFISVSSVKIFSNVAVVVNYSSAISFFSHHFIVSAITILFYGFLVKITEHIDALNKVLKNLSHQWDSRSLKAITQKQRSMQCLDSFTMYTIVTKDPAEIIQESMEIHHLICEAAATANKYFTYQLLTIISIAFLIIVFDAYYVLETLLGKSKRESKFKTVEFVTFFSCQMILYLIAIISIVEGSNRAIKKSEKTGGIVHSLLIKAKSNEVKEKLQQFSMQLMHLKIKFTAAGLFNIDRSLYFTISGALTTYLIILLQFTTNSPEIGGCENCESRNLTSYSA